MQTALRRRQRKDGRPTGESQPVVPLLAGAGGDGGATLRCSFAPTRDVLFVVLPRELLVFDLELGRPVVAASLPKASAGSAGILN